MIGTGKDNVNVDPNQNDKSDRGYLPPDKDVYRGGSMLPANESRELNTPFAQQLIPFNELKYLDHVRWNHLSTILLESEHYLRIFSATINILENGLHYFDEALKPSAKDRKMMNAMFKEISNLGNLVSYFRLAFTHEISYLETDVKEILLRETTAKSKEFRSKKIKVKPLFTHIPLIVSSPESLSICIRSIIQNVLEFAKSPSELIIDCSVYHHQTEKNMSIEFTHPVDHYREIDLQNCFSLFYSSREANLGLGLTICKEVMNILKGDVSVTTFPGPIIRTTLTFPV
ncbi:ATP-binding protein [candidate division KSB1 bacterium]